MSTLNVKVVKLSISAHPNAERLELATIGGEGGFNAVVGKGQFKDNDLGIFIPENSVVPSKIQEFLAKSQKITVKDGRIRCSKIRGVFSDGLCLTPSEWLPAELIKDDQDVTEYLGITKYEPPPPSNRAFGLKSKGINYHYVNTNFKEYTDVENFKKYPRTFKDGEEVVATIKYHGSNWRAAIVDRPKSSFTWFERIKRFLGFNVEKMEYLVGSHYSIKRKSKKAKIVEDKFVELAQKYDVQNMLEQLQLDFSHEGVKPEVAIYGELIGPGVQTGYSYGLEEGTNDLKIFDIMVNGRYLDFDLMSAICVEYSLPVVECVYRGPWNLEITKLAEAVDEYNGRKHVREGIVVRTVLERRDVKSKRAILKYISETFRLDKTNSEYH